MIRGHLAPLCVLAGLALSTAANADTFTVTTVVENVAGSLGTAMQDARDSASPDDVIVLDPADGTIFVLSSSLGPAEEFLFDGTAQTGLLVDGSALGTSPIFSTGQFGRVTLRNVSYLGTLAIGGQVDLDTPAVGDIMEVEHAEGLLPELRKLGPGTARITGDFDFSALGLTGSFVVEEGTLEVTNTGSVALEEFSVQSGARLDLIGNGGLGVARFDLMSGGLLTGDGGTVSALQSLVLSGRVSPGSAGAVGSLILAGAPEFRSGSALEIDLLPGDDGDTLTVVGSTPQIGPGADLLLAADLGDFPNAGDSTTHTFFTSVNEDIQGQFDVVGPAFFEPPQLVQAAREITVTLTRAAGGTSLESLGITPNQRAVGRLLDDDGGALAGVIADVIASPAGEIPGLFDAIGGETLTASATVRQALAERSARALHRRARDPSWGSPRAFYAVDAPDEGTLPDVAALGRTRIRPSAWLDAFGGFGRFEGGSEGAADLDTTLAGATLGLDAWICDEFVTGIAAGYAHGEVRPDGRDHDLSADTVQAALYGGWSSPLGFASAYGRYAHSFLDSVRDIESSLIDRRARADWQAQDWGVGAEAGATLLSGGSFGLQPIVGVDYLQLDEESYRESGAAELGLSVRPERLESLTTRVGARVFGQVDLDGEGLLTPELRAFWHHEHGDTDRRLRARLAGATVPVRGAELPRDAAILGIGWSASVGEALTVLLDYDALLDADRVEHQGNLSVRVRF